MDSHEILTECTLQFTQINKGLAVMERKQDRTNENLANLATDIAVIKAHQENHLQSQGKSLDRLWKIMYVLIGSAVGGGSAAGIVSWLG